jgi:hypothetical protein
MQQHAPIAAPAITLRRGRSRSDIVRSEGVGSRPVRKIVLLG